MSVLSAVSASNSIIVLLMRDLAATKLRSEHCSDTTLKGRVPWETRLRVLSGNAEFSEHF